MKKALAIVLTLCMLLSLAACGSSTTPAPSSSTPAPSSSSEPVVANEPEPAVVRDSLIYSIVADNSSFDPMLSVSVGVRMNYQVFECLIREQAVGQLEPGLAESWTVAEDNLSVTFKIRENVKFHNGDTMTAEDVAFSLNRAIAGSDADAVSYMDEAVIDDDTHVTLKLKSVYSDILSALSVVNMAIVSKRAVEELGESFGTNPVGTGPYMLDSWTSGVSVVLKAFPDYWRGEAPIKNVTVLIQSNPSTAAIALENHEVDAVHSLNADDIEHLKTVEGITVYQQNSVSTYTLYLNTVSGVTADPRVRQAIALCIDRQEICDGAFIGCEPAATIISPSMAFHNEAFQVSEPNIEAAKALLAEAGYADGLSIKYATVAEVPSLGQAGVLLQGQLAKAGINLEIDTQEFSAWFQNVQYNHDFDVTCAATTTNATATNAILSNILVTGAINNLGQYHNDRVEELLKQAISTFDDSEKQACYDEITEIILDECPVIALATTVSAMAVNSDVAGVVLPNVYFYDWSWAN